jgi:hypothetical protein
VPTLLAALALVGACSNAEPATAPDPTPDATRTPDDTPIGSEPAREPAGPPPDAEALADVWEAFHKAWTEQAAADIPDPTAFTDLAVDPQQTIEMLAAQRGESRLVAIETELWPQFDIDGDRAEVTDCAIVTQHPHDQPDSPATVTIGWQATAVAAEDGWRIDDARQLDLFCIAEELNDQIVEAYRDWLDAHSVWSEPPDPDHPLLDETMAEPGLSDMRAMLTEDRKSGISMRFPHEARATITSIGPGAVRVTDCYLAPDGYGAFDVESGERRGDIVPPPEPGQLNRTVADFERTDQGWRVVGWRWEERSECEPGESRYATR